MPKPRGRFVGHKQFVVDPNWIKSQQEIRAIKERKRFVEWSKNWITVTSLLSTFSTSKQLSLLNVGFGTRYFF
ncbi:hypothetical protein [Vibrio sp. 10N.239.312.D08]|uniref:hypothetical protein n=1 Tax=Vibrio sp. 10N.239.312.D08 TaxID=3229978 RepID=UPI0035529444